MTEPSGYLKPDEMRRIAAAEKALRPPAVCVRCGGSKIDPRAGGQCGRCAGTGRESPLDGSPKLDHA